MLSPYALEKGESLDILNVDVTIWIQQMTLRKAYGQSIFIVDIFEVWTLVWGEVLIESSIVALVDSFENVVCRMEVFFFFERVCRMEVGWTDTCEIFLLVHFSTRSWNYPTKVHQLKSLLLFSPPSWIFIDLESNIETVTVQGMLTVFWVWFCLLGLYGLWSALSTFIISFLFHVTSLLELWKMMFNLRSILETNTNFQLLMESHLVTFSIAWFQGCVWNWAEKGVNPN